MAARKPLQFNLDTANPVSEPDHPRRLAQGAQAAEKGREERQQVGARIRAKTYRQLKARAALEGRKVQELVELAVEKYLAELES
jgi:hypothetical protein